MTRSKLLGNRCLAAHPCRAVVSNYPIGDRERALVEWNRERRLKQNHELFKAAQNGDQHATWQLILNHQPLIYAEIKKVVDDSNLRGHGPEHSAGWAHEAMGVAHTKFDQVQGEYPQFVGWLRKVARNLGMSRTVQEQKAQQSQIPVDMPPPLAISPGADYRLEQGFREDEAAALLAALKHCLLRLKQKRPDLHDVVYLYYAHEFSAAEVQERLAASGDFIGEGAVRKRVANARQELARCIGRRVSRE